MRSDKEKMTREDFIEAVKKLGFPVTVQGRKQLAQRRQESVEIVNKDIEKYSRTLPED